MGALVRVDSATLRRRMLLELLPQIIVLFLFQELSRTKGDIKYFRLFPLLILIFQAWGTEKRSLPKEKYK